MKVTHKIQDYARLKQVKKMRNRVDKYNHLKKNKTKSIQKKKMIDT